MKKIILSMLLAIFMVVGLLPTAVFAAEGDNLCDHHTEHTADCGYVRDITPVQITGVSITIDGVVYDSSNTSAEDPAVVTPNSNVILTITGTNLHNGSDDHRVDYANGIYQPVTPDYCEISEDGTTATYAPSAGDFAKCSNFEITYCNNDTDTANRTVVPTGIYLTYDDGIAEEDKARITGMSITIDGVVYDSSNTSAEDPAVITPNTGFITITVHGTALQNCTADHMVSYYAGSSEPILPNSLWRFEADGTSAFHHYSSASALSDFARNTTPYELQYSNNGSFNAANPAIGSGVYIVYDDSTGGEEDTTPAQITGVSITIDGVVYDSSNTSAENPAVINPRSTVTLTVTGTNLQNGTEDNLVEYAYGAGDPVGPDHFEISEDGSTATSTPPAGRFANSSNFEIKYYNNYTDIENRTEISTGIYLTYDDGIEVNTTLAIGDNEIADGYTYTYTAEQDGSLYITVTELYYGGNGDVNEDNLGSWCAIEINGTAITEFANSTEVKTGDTVTVELISLDNDTYHGTVNLSWDAPVMAEITGVSITIDGVEYVGSDTSAENPAVITSEAASVILTVHGTNLQNATSDYLVVFGPAGNSIGLGGAQWTMSEDGSWASYDMTWLVEEFTESLPTWEIKYSNDGGLEDAVTGLYVKYEHIPEEEEPIVIIQQPTDGEAKLGERYCVEVIAQGEGLRYQWYFKNAGSEQWHTSGVKDNTYDDVMTTARMNRQVYCVITDSHGNSVITDTASLIALKSVDLAVTKQPESVTANYGERFTVTAEAVGDGVTYEWYYLDPDGESWLSTNVRSATYSGKMSEKNNERAVYCVARDIWGNQVATNAVLLSCERAELAITKQPNDSSAKLDEMFCVEVLAEGDGLKYQWYWRQIGAENWNLSGQRDNSYDDVMTSARHNREVYCVITDAWGDSVTTEIATITGMPEVTLEITAQPESQIVMLGEMFNVTFEARGDGLKYQWYFRPAGTEVWYTSGQRDNSYDDVMTSARHNRELYCVVTDAWGNTVETSPVVVIMAIPRHELAITAQPENESVKMGEMFCVTVDAQGDELKYQWYWRNVGSETWNVSGQRDNTYDDVMTKARHNREVKCVITDMWGESVETEIATITAIPDQLLAIVTQPTDATAVMGENYCVTVEAQGDGLTYQWYFKNAGSDVWHTSGVKDNTYDDVMIASRAGRQVYCVITDIWGNTVTTETVTLVCNDISQAIAMN